MLTCSNLAGRCHNNGDQLGNHCSNKQLGATTLLTCSTCSNLAGRCHNGDQLGNHCSNERLEVETSCKVAFKTHHTSSVQGKDIAASNLSIIEVVRVLLNSAVYYTDDCARQRDFPMHCSPADCTCVHVHVHVLCCCVHCKSAKNAASYLVGVR